MLAVNHLLRQPVSLASSPSLTSSCPRTATFNYLSPTINDFSSAPPYPTTGGTVVTLRESVSTRCGIHNAALAGEFGEQVVDVLCVADTAVKIGRFCH